MHKCPHAHGGGQRFASPKKVPGLTRPPSRRFAWAFSALGRPTSGMRTSPLSEEAIETDEDEGGRECLPVVDNSGPPGASHQSSQSIITQFITLRQARQG